MEYLRCGPIKELCRGSYDKLMISVVKFSFFLVVLAALRTLAEKVIAEFMIVPKSNVFQQTYGRRKVFAITNH